MQVAPRILDLFCGAGGLSLGAYAAGMAPALAIDVDPILTSSYTSNFPRARLALADVAKIDGASVLEAVGRVDGIIGGPPCQAFSTIGLRKPRDKRRSYLQHFFRLVAEIEPAFFVMENVKGLGYSDTRHLLQRGLDLVSHKYSLTGPVVLDAADFGAATRRPRLFVIGYDPYRCDPITVAKINELQRKPTTVREAIADISSSEMVGEKDGFDIWKITQRGTPNAYAASMRAKDRTFTGHKRTQHTDEVVRRFAKVKQGEVEEVGRHPRLHWSGLCPTLRAGTGNDRGSFQSVRPIHPKENRVITVREAARLQGFPDAFRFHPTVWHSFRMIGNSVSPIMSWAIFSAIAASFSVAPQIAAE